MWPPAAGLSGLLCINVVNLVLTERKLIIKRGLRTDLTEQHRIHWEGGQTWHEMDRPERERGAPAGPAGAGVAGILPLHNCVICLAAQCKYLELRASCPAERGSISSSFVFLFLPSVPWVSCSQQGHTQFSTWHSTVQTRSPTRWLTELLNGDTCYKPSFCSCSNICRCEQGRQDGGAQVATHHICLLQLWQKSQSYIISCLAMQLNTACPLQSLSSLKWYL